MLWALAISVHASAVPIPVAPISTVPISFKALQIAAMQAQHDAKQLDETWEIESTHDGGTERTKVSLVKFDEKYSVKILVDNKLIYHTGYDGKILYVVDIASKKFRVQPSSLPETSYSAEARYPKTKVAKVLFNIDQDSGLFIYGEAIHLKHLNRSIEQGRECWKAVAQLKRPGIKAVLITEWFYTNNWIPFKFSIRAGAESTQGALSEISFKVKPNDARFTLKRPYQPESTNLRIIGLLTHPGRREMSSRLTIDLGI